MTPTPFETEEYREREKWIKALCKGAIRPKPITAIAGWSDICGFGALLDSHNWDLKNITNPAIYHALSLAYATLGKPFSLFSPSERVLVINDGIARTLDIEEPSSIEPHALCFYIRDVLMNHYILEEHLYSFKLGLRTILTGGSRAMYSPEKVTGESVWYHDGSRSERDKELLEQTFVYNPAEFQMNTAFAKAFTIDSLGSQGGITPNRAYYTESWLEIVSSILEVQVENSKSEIDLCFSNNKALTIKYDKIISVNVKGLQEKLFRVSEFIVREFLEREETVFKMNKHDKFTLNGITKS